MKQDMETKLIVLNRIFDVYDKFSSRFQTACEAGCAECCTRNVTLTGLEGYNIINSLSADEKKEKLGQLEAARAKKRFIPRITVNRMAKLCMEGKEIPEESSDPGWGACPLLVGQRCSIYSVRPFACRCMMSKNKCAEYGFADMDDFAVTLNNVFIQYIEHIDNGGIFGNLTDVLLKVGGETGSGQPDVDDAGNPLFVENCAVEMLMVPPEHQERIREVIQELQKI